MTITFVFAENDTMPGIESFLITLWDERVHTSCRAVAASSGIRRLLLEDLAKPLHARRDPNLG